MKILLTTEGETLKSKIAKRFGEAPYYLVYDSETKELHASVNQGHDDHHQSLVDLVNNGVTHFLIGNTGPNAFNVLKNAGAKMYLVRQLTAEQALEKLLNSELEELTQSTLKKPIRK